MNEKYRIEMPRSLIFVIHQDNGTWKCITEDCVAGITTQYQPDFDGIMDDIEIITATSIEEVIECLGNKKYVKSITQLEN